jgi:hypothetical protein
VLGINEHRPFHVASLKPTNVLHKDSDILLLVLKQVASSAKESVLENASIWVNDLEKSF